MTKTIKNLNKQLQEMVNLQIYIMELRENQKKEQYYNEDLYLNLCNQKYKIQNKISKGNFLMDCKLEKLCQISINISKYGMSELIQEQANLINKIIEIATIKKTA